MAYTLIGVDNDLPKKYRYYHRKFWCRKISRKQATLLLKRMHKLMWAGEICIIYKSSLHPWSGFIDYKEELKVKIHIILNPRRSLLPTFLHEMLHALSVHSSEREIYAMEHQMMILLSDRQLENLTIKLAENLKNGAVPTNVLETFEHKSKEELKGIIKEQKKTARIRRQAEKINDGEH